MGGGITQPVIDRITELEKKVNQINNALPGKLDASKVTNSTTVTEQGYAADARQLNPAVGGSLANSLQKQGDEIDKCIKRVGIGVFNANVFWDIGDQSLIHSKYDYVPVIPATSHFVFLVTFWDSVVHSVTALPIDYETRIFVYKGSTGKWYATELLVAQN